MQCAEGSTRIIRRSSTVLLSEKPHVVEWKAEYSGELEGQAFHFEDSIPNRAFTRPEVVRHLGNHKYEVVSQGDNFDETSFYTLAKRKVGLP